jgi:hypothetical protein
MKASTRAFALRAAAKAALSVSLAGCGGATLSPATDDSGAAPVTTHTPDSGPADAARGTTPAEAGATPEAGEARVGTSEPCSGIPAEGDAAVSKDTFTCCTSYLSPGADAAFATLGVDAAAPASRTCCSVVISYVDRDTTGNAYAAAEQVIPACCNDLRPTPIGRACTPWGPPVPPVMHDARWEVA